MRGWASTCCGRLEPPHERLFDSKQSCASLRRGAPPCYSRGRNRRGRAHGRSFEGSVAGGGGFPARSDGPVRPSGRSLPQLGDGGRFSRPDRRGRIPRGRRTLPSDRLARLPVGAPHAHLPQAQGAREHDLALGRPLAARRARLDLRPGSKRHSRPDLRLRAAEPVLPQSAPRLLRPGHRTGAVGQGVEHHRQ